MTRAIIADRHWACCPDCNKMWQSKHLRGYALGCRTRFVCICSPQPLAPGAPRLIAVGDLPEHKPAKYVYAMAKLFASNLKELPK
jgi:hypothetical protein